MKLVFEVKKAKKNQKVKKYKKNQNTMKEKKNQNTKMKICCVVCSTDNVFIRIVLKAWIGNMLCEKFSKDLD